MNGYGYITGSRTRTRIQKRVNYGFTPETETFRSTGGPNRWLLLSSSKNRTAFIIEGRTKNTGCVSANNAMDVSLARPGPRYQTKTYEGKVSGNLNSFCD